MQNEEEASALDMLSQRLSPSGWSVHIQSSVNMAFTVELAHELTVPFLATFWRGRPSQDEFIAKTLNHAEIDIISAAPPELPHKSLIGSIRRSAHASEWPDSVVSTIARILSNHDLLTDEEATWLDEAGVPWAEPDSNSSGTPIH